MDKFFAQQLKKSGQTTDQQVPEESKNDSRTTGGAGAGSTGEVKKFPKGVVLGKDGKPCRSCTSFADWAALTKKSTKSTSSSPSTSSSSTTNLSSVSDDLPPPDCPPDVNTLGNHTWTLLHTISANYPTRASPTQQSEMKQFLYLFSKLYPCWVCADDFRDWMQKGGNEPRVEGRSGLGKWMCEAHNEVNRKLGKKEFDCSQWEERWRTGWKDGRCD